MAKERFATRSKKQLREDIKRNQTTVKTTPKQPLPGTRILTPATAISWRDVYVG